MQLFQLLPLILPSIYLPHRTQHENTDANPFQKCHVGPVLKVITFSKKYSASTTKQAPFKVTREEIAQSLEKMMNSVLKEIAKDGELHQYLTENV